MGWGDCNWGQFSWGATSCSVNGLGSQADAKPDTVFYGTDATGTVATLATDLSQHETDFTAAATWIHSANAETRLTPRDRFAMETRIDATTGVTTGTIMSIRDEVGATQLLEVDRSGAADIRLLINGSAIITITLTGLAAGARKIAIMASATPNPLTTGAGDAVQYELSAWEESTGAEHHGQAASAAMTSTSDFRMIWNAQTSAGGTAYALPFYRARYGRAFHSSVEMWEDWVTPTAVGGSTVRAGMPRVMPERTQVEVADEGDFSGPAYLVSSRRTRDLSYYTVSPAVNYATDVPNQWTVADFANEGIFQDTFARGPLYTAAYVFAAVPPPHMNRWRFGVTLTLTGATTDTKSVGVEMSCIGRWLSGSGDLGRITSSSILLQSTTATTETLTEAKQWLSIPASEDGRVYFMLGFDFNEGDPADTFSVDRIQIEWARAEQATLTGVGGGG